MVIDSDFEQLMASVRRCSLCQDLPLGPAPLLQASSAARILIAGQAPGRKTHARGIPFDDASGERLRDWLGVTREQFYDPALFAILPMGFCYPGTGASGDLPPRPECAATWRAPLLSQLPNLELEILIGGYAIEWHLGRSRQTLTERVRDWAAHWPQKIALPHPSPRNNIWLKRNGWFEAEIVPVLRERVATLLDR